MTTLKTKCVPCEGGVAKLTASQCTAFLKQLNGWTHAVNGLTENDFILAAKLEE